MARRAGRALHFILRSGCLLAAALSPALVCAQTGYAVAVESDHRFRGVSVSGEKPALRLSVAHDAPGGWFAGASVANVRVRAADRAQLVVQAGVARRVDALAWEAGVTGVHYFGASQADYAELFGGLIGDRWNVRLHLSPDYYGGGTGTAYAEANVGVPVHGAVAWFGHAGVLRALSGGDDYYGPRHRVDLRSGLSWTVRALELQLAWVYAGRGGPGGYGSSDRTWVLSAAWYF